MSLSVFSTEFDGGQAGERERRRVDMRQRVGLLGDDRRRDRKLLAIGAFTPALEHAEHRVAGFEVGDAGADSGDHAGKIAARNEGRLGVGMPRIGASAEFPVSGIDTGGMNIDQDLPGRGGRIRQVAIAQHFRSAELFEIDRFHRNKPPGPNFFKAVPIT